MIEVNCCAGQALLEGVEAGEVIDLQRAPMQREVGARPVIDEVVAERP
jgi:hypothetical protein